MKITIKLSLLFVFLPTVLTACASAQTAGFLSDKVVLAELGKLNGKEFGKDDVCIKRLNESAKIVVVGLKGEDSICRLDGVFVETLYLKKDNSELSKTALRFLGWEKANEQARRKLAKLWVERVLFAFSAQSNQIFQVAALDNDAVKVTASLRFPPGVTSRRAPKTFVFDKDGSSSPTGDY